MDEKKEWKEEILMGKVSRTEGLQRCAQDVRNGREPLFT